MTITGEIWVTLDSSSSRRRFQVSYSSCHWTLSRWSEAGDKGAPSPNSPRSASSKSPNASPCKYNCGSNSPTCLVRRWNRGRRRLTKRSARLRTRGRCTVIVPHVRVSFRGLPYPLRYPSGASRAARRSGAVTTTIESMPGAEASAASVWARSGRPATDQASLSTPPIRREVPAATTMASLATLAGRLNPIVAGRRSSARRRSAGPGSPPRRGPCRCAGHHPRRRSSCRRPGSRPPGRPPCPPG